MRGLIIKMSSMGDVLHTLPAVTDAQQKLPGITFDWVIEEDFQELPTWHDAINSPIVIAQRRWRKHWLRAWRSGEIKAFLKALRQQRYDVIIDAQGLFKSALVRCCAKGNKHGYDRQSATEGFSTFGQHSHRVDPQQHAVERTRYLFAQALGYTKPDTPPDYGIQRHFQSLGQAAQKPYLVFIHNTSWESKLYPETYWLELGKRANQAGYQVILTSGNAEEKARADRIAAALEDAQALPRLSLAKVGTLLSHATGALAVDTGFAHMAAALALPCVSLYGATNPTLTSAYGQNQINLQAEFTCAPCMKRTCQHPDRLTGVNPPCFGTLPPESVWQALLSLMD